MKKFIVLLFLAAPLAAAVPNKITYQGRLMKSGLTAAGPHIFQVNFIPPAPSAPIPSPQQTVTLPATGDFTLIIDLPVGVDFFNSTYQLQLLVDSVPLSPNDDFTAVPYALVAATATTVSAGGVTLVGGTQNLSSWQSTTNGHPDLIDPSKLDGTQTSVATGLVPSGAIIIWNKTDSCPTGYLRVTTFDGLFLRGASTAEGFGGSSTHTHTMDHTHDMSHTHDMGNHTHSGTTSSDGLHNHGGVTGGNLTQGQGDKGANAAAIWHTHSISMDGLHSHSFTSGPPSTNTTGPASTTTTGPATPDVTGIASNIPPYHDVLFCEKE